MKKFLFNNKKWIILFLLTIWIILTLWLLFSEYGVITEFIQKRQAEQLDEIECKVVDRIDRKFVGLMKIREEEGIERIRYTDKETSNEVDLSCNGKYVVAVDMKGLKNDEEIEVFVTPKGKSEKSLKIKFNACVGEGNYVLSHGVYVNAPDLSGYNENYTRYLEITEEGNLTPGNWVKNAEPEYWYDYKNQKWANIYTENNGVEAYFVWVPRYMYKISETENQRMDIKFVDVNDNYINADTGETLTYEQLAEQGYKIPDAFWWGDKNEKISAGYWMSKYQLSELESYILDYNTAGTKTTIKIQGIKTNTSKEIAKYTYSINGKVVHRAETNEDFTIEGITERTNYINVTALDSNDEIVASMTKISEPVDVNPPDLSGFDPDTTFYVYWDENDLEHNEIPISKEAPADWYDYGLSNWANIVTRNNGIETYLVWIPRYQYKLDNVKQRSNVKFILEDGTNVYDGYQIPDAFKWGDNNEKEITGYWISKYQLSIEESAQKLDAEITAGSSIIKVKDIKGTLVSDNLKYEYYLNGNKVHNGTESNENYAYTDLDANTTYTINIIARNSETDEYVGAITKKVKTVDANKPELWGFNTNENGDNDKKLPVTYYVTYDDDGNEVIGNKIKNDGSNSPSNWYNYTENKWANIVITDGVVADGKITGATLTTYLVWIPRYEYRITTDRANLSLENRRTNVNFIQGTSTETTTGYTIPDAFKWGDSGEKQITGYWMAKYQLSN